MRRNMVFGQMIRLVYASLRSGTCIIHRLSGVFRVHQNSILGSVGTKSEIHSRHATDSLLLCALVSVFEWESDEFGEQCVVLRGVLA